VAVSYPIHSSVGGRFGGLHINGEARNFNKSSTEYLPDMIKVVVLRLHW